jgi:hypothetical protein
VLAIGLAFDDELPCGALQPVDCGLGEEGICHEAQPFTWNWLTFVSLDFA